MKTMNECKVNHIEETIVITKRFANAAGILNTPEYNQLKQVRHEFPNYVVVLREIKKKEGKKSYKNLTFENMEIWISMVKGYESDDIKDFRKVKELSKIQAGAYAFVKTWFLNHYGNEYNDSEVVA